jgi:hypothetical protein
MIKEKIAKTINKTESLVILFICTALTMQRIHITKDPIPTHTNKIKAASDKPVKVEMLLIVPSAAIIEITKIIDNISSISRVHANVTCLFNFASNIDII